MFRNKPSRSLHRCRSFFWKYRMNSSRLMELASWPEAARIRLQDLILRHANSGAFAVFDADQTTYQHDLVSAFLPFLEAKGVLTRDTMHPSLKLIPFFDRHDYQESLYSYYERLGQIDDQIAYPWASQIFAGFQIRQLKIWMDEMLALTSPLTAQVSNGITEKTDIIEVPKMLKAQQELYAALQSHGIEVFVVTAAAEELVRMIVADPQYGYVVKPENVIGVNLALRHPVSLELSTSRKKIEEGCYSPELMQDYELTPTLWAPMPWYEGKYAAIRSFIHKWRKPILVAGDTPQSDGPMFFRAPDLEKGGLRLFVNKGPRYLAHLQQLQDQHEQAQLEQGLQPNAKENWLIVDTHQLLGACS